MDPLSVAASVAGLINLSGDITQAVYRYGKSVKNAGSSIQDMAQELASLQSVLERFCTFLRTGELDAICFEQSSALSLALSRCRDVLSDLSGRLQNMNKNKINKAVESFKWPFSEKDLLKTGELLRSCSSTFQFSMTVEGW